jgi:replication-associated recombination protein RarA
MITLPNVEEIRSVQSRSRQHLGQRLEYERARRFVGRDAELELFAARLATTRTRASEADLFSVLWVHGPGGIGKSSLLQAYARAARKAGFAVAHADGEGLLSSPAGIRAAATDSLADVIIIDAADRLGTAEDWLPDEFLPALPAKTVVAIASRRPPAAAWLSDPGWRNLLRVILLRNLSTEAVRALLDVERIPKVVLEQGDGVDPRTPASGIATDRRHSPISQGERGSGSSCGSP